MEGYKIRSLTIENIKEIKESDRKFSDFFDQNKGFIHKLVLKFVKKHDDRYDDFFQLGCIGLLRAFDKFNPERPGSGTFSTFAWYCILNDLRLEAKKHRRHKFREGLMEDMPYNPNDERQTRINNNRLEQTYTPVFCRPVAMEQSVICGISKTQWHTRLTEIEQQVAELRLQNYTRKEIATILNKKTGLISAVWSNLSKKSVFRELNQ